MKRICLVCLTVLLALSFALPAFAAKYGLSGEYDGWKLTVAAQYPAEGQVQSAVVIAESKDCRQLIFCRRDASGWEPIEYASAALPQPGSECSFSIEMTDADSFTLTWRSADSAPDWTYSFAQGAWTDGSGAFEHCMTLRSAVSFDGSIRIDREWDEGLTFRADDASVSLPDIPLKYFNSALLPADAQQARRLSDALSAGYPALGGQAFLKAEESAAAPVYAAPSQGAYRAAGGKASVALQGGLNSWGSINANGEWLLIEYAINPAVSRTGFISAEEHGVLTSEAVNCCLTFAPQLVCIVEDTFLTNDPMYSQRALSRLSQGDAVTLLTVLSPLYAYVQTELDGQLAYGFVPLKAIDPDVSGLAPEARILGLWSGYAGGAGEMMYFLPDGTYLSDEGYHDDRGTWRIEPLTDELMAQEEFWYTPEYVLFLEHDGISAKPIGLSFAQLSSEEAYTDTLAAGSDLLQFIYGSEGSGCYIREPQTPPISQEEYDAAHG